MIVSIPPAAYATAGSTAGWNTGKLTAAAAAALQGGNIPVISGLKQTPQNLLADIAPSGDDLLAVVSFSVPYSLLMQDSVDATSFTGRARLRLTRNGAQVYTATDEQPGVNVATAGNPNWVTAGEFTGDLINPIVIRPGDVLAIALDYYNPWILQNCSAAIGVQIAPAGGLPQGSTTAQQASLDVQQLTQAGR